MHVPVPVWPAPGSSAGVAAPRGMQRVCLPASLPPCLPASLQILGVSLVMAGVCLAAWPQGGGSPLDGELSAALVVAMPLGVANCRAVLVPPSRAAT